MKTRYVLTDNDEVVTIYRTVVHRFSQGYVEDPDLYSRQYILKWQYSPEGEYIMKYSLGTPEIHRDFNHVYGNWRYAIVAELEEKKLSEFYFKFGVPDDKPL